MSITNFIVLQDIFLINIAINRFNHYENPWLTLTYLSQLFASQ